MTIELKTNVSATQKPEVFLVYQHNANVHYLPERLLKGIEIAVHELATSAERGHALTLKQHFGTRLWNEISSDQPVLAGYCMAYLVANHRVPFRAMGIHSSSKAQMYALI